VGHLGDAQHGFTSGAAEGMVMAHLPPNNPAAGNAGIAPRLRIGHHWPGVPEPERWAKRTESRLYL